tara:strand:- start:4502 stop:5707 length:1206 start_codon:yes stop_codon:yes gene_type:complete
MSKNHLLIAFLVLSMVGLAIGDSLVLVNGDDLNGSVTLLPEGRIELSHGILGKVDLASKDVTAGQIKVTLADGSVVSGLLVGWRSSAWIIKPVDESPVELVFGDEGELKRSPAPVGDPSEVTGDEAAEEGKVSVDEQRLDETTAKVKDAYVDAAKARMNQAKAIVDAATEKSKKVWSGRFRLGGSLSQGTSDTANVLLNVGLKREVEGSKTDLTAFYILNTKGTRTTQNWFQANLDQQWKAFGKKNRWSVFGVTTFDYQQQADWEQRVNANLGIEYLLVDAKRAPGTDWFRKFKFTGRVAPGIRKEFAGANSDPALELLLGGIWDIQFLDKLSFTGNAQVFPDMTDIGEFRITANAAVKFGLDMIEGMAVGVDFRYQFQSKVGPGEIDYLFVISGFIEYEF